VTQVRDPSAIFWNPALLSALKDRELLVTVNNLFEFNQLSATQFVPGKGTFGAALSRLADSTGNIDGATLAWGRRFAPWLTLGSRVTVETQNDNWFSSFAWGFYVGKPRLGTIGTPWRRQQATTLLERLNFGMTFQDIPLSNDMFDFSALLGLSYLWPKVGLLLNSGYHVQAGENVLHVGVGFELTPGVKLLSGVTDGDLDQLGLGLSYAHRNLVFNVAYSTATKQLLFSLSARISSAPSVLARPHLRRARSHLSARHYQAASTELKKYLSFELANPESDSIQKVVEVLDAQVARIKYTVDSLLTAAGTYLSPAREPKYLRAAYLYTRVLELDPGNESAQAGLRILQPVVAQSVNRFLEDGIAKFENKQYVDAQKQFFRVLIFAPEHSEAKAYLTKIEQALSDIAEEHFYRGVGYYRQKNYQVAKREFESALRYDPKLGEAESYLAKTKRKIAEMGSRLDQLLADARSLERRGRYFEATNKYLQVLRIDSQNPTAQSRIDVLRPRVARAVNERFNEGMRYYREGDYRRAQRILAGVLSIDPKHKAAKLNLAKIKQERREQVKHLLATADEALRKNDYEQARKLYAEVLQIDPDNERAKAANDEIALKVKTDGLLERARKLVMAQDYVKAIDVYHDALGLQPGNNAVKLELADAEKLLAEALEKRFNHGIRLYTQDRYEEAIKVMDEILSINPQHRGAREYRRQASERLKALKKL